MKASSSGASTSAPVAHNALPPPSTSSAGRSSRIAPHSHIKGLGLNAEGLANTDSAGFIGQTNAREVRHSRTMVVVNSLTGMIKFALIGLWCCGRLDKIAQILGTRLTPCGGARNRKNCPRTGCIA